MEGDDCVYRMQSEKRKVDDDVAGRSTDELLYMFIAKCSEVKRKRQRVDKYQSSCAKTVTIQGSDRKQRVLGILQ